MEESEVSRPVMLECAEEFMLTRVDTQFGDTTGQDGGGIQMGEGGGRSGVGHCAMRVANVSDARSVGASTP